jgi:ribosomal-protein-alanine N-acetyltransferase
VGAHRAVRSALQLIIHPCSHFRVTGRVGIFHPPTAFSDDLPHVILRTERLILREFTADDWQATYAYQSDPRYLRFYDYDDITQRQVQAFVYMFILWQGEQPRSKAQLAITLADTGELIGNVGLRRESAGDPLADLGYELSPEHWGHGYATEAARAMIEWGFGACDGVERIHAHCIADNEASARVLLKAGLRREALLREHQCFKGRYWDVAMFGMLRADWEAGA